MTPPVKRQELEEESGSYFTAKVREGIDEILTNPDLPRFDTVEELFEDLKDDEEHP